MTRYRKKVEKWAIDAKLVVVTSMKEIEGKRYVPVETVWQLIKSIETVK
jgi:hypothetical protein